MNSPLPIALKHESWKLAQPFIIARGSKTSAETVVVEVWDGTHTGLGESVPYGRYNETITSVLGQLGGIAKQVRRDLRGDELEQMLPAGAARNALDCALWDLRAKQAGRRIWDMLGQRTPAPVRCTDMTISLDTPTAMAAATMRALGEIKHNQSPRLKIKLGGSERDAGTELDRLRAVRDAAPLAELIVDANEGWTAAMLPQLASKIGDFNIMLVEQPLPATDDDALRMVRLPCPVFADESIHDRASLANIEGKYQGINIKLDKTGGLTEALALKKAATDMGLQIMVGCMVASSLAIAPAVLIAQEADFADLDGPLLLAQDRPHGLSFDGGFIAEPDVKLWG